MDVDGTATEESIINAVKKTGYGASIQEKIQTKTENVFYQNSNIKYNLIVSVILVIILMYFSMSVTMLHLPLPSFF